MWYGRYVYMWPAKALIAFDIRGVLVACWYLVSGIVISESCDHCRLRAAKLDWNVDCAQLLHKLTGKLMDGWVSRNTKHIDRMNSILIRKWSVNLVRHLTICAFKGIDDGDLILWQVLKLIARHLWTLAAHKHHQWCCCPLTPLPYHPLVRSFKYIHLFLWWCTRCPFPIPLILLMLAPIRHTFRAGPMTHLLILAPFTDRQ